MKRFVTAMFVLATIAALVIGSSADVRGGGPPLPSGGCEAETIVITEVTLSPISGDPLVDVDETADQVYSATVDFYVLAGADSEAWAKKGDHVVAMALATGDASGKMVLLGPGGGVIDSDSFVAGAFDIDVDYSRKYAEADASAIVKGSATLQVTLPVNAVQLKEGYLYVVDAKALAEAFAGAWSAWCAHRGGGWCMDMDWASAFDRESLAIRIVNHPHMKLEFRVTAGCVVEVTPYADFATGRLGSRTFEKAAYLQDDPYVPGGLKYEPAVFELLGEVWYHTDLWCPVEAESPLGAGIVSSVDFRVLHTHNGYQQIWGEPFHNQPANRIAGLEFVNAWSAQ